MWRNFFLFPFSMTASSVYVNSSSSSSKDSMVWRQTKNIYFPTQFPPSYIYTFHSFSASPCSVIKCVMYVSTVPKWEMPSSQALAIRSSTWLCCFWNVEEENRKFNISQLTPHISCLSVFIVNSILWFFLFTFFKVLYFLHVGLIAPCCERNR